MVQMDTGRELEVIIKIPRRHPVPAASLLMTPLVIKLPSAPKDDFLLLFLEAIYIQILAPGGGGGGIHSSPRTAPPQLLPPCAVPGRVNFSSRSMISGNDASP